MFKKFFRSAFFLRILMWAAPKIWAQIKKRRAKR